MNMKKLIAALLLAVMLLSAVSAFAASFKKGEYVYFSGSAYGYKSHNARHKTKTIVTKGSWSIAVGNQNGNWVPVYLDIADSLWFNKKYLKHILEGSELSDFIDETGIKWCIGYGSGGYGRSLPLLNTEERYGEKYAYIKADGKCNIREAPCLACDTFGTLKKGKKLDYLGKRCADTRGIWWYKVEYKKSKNDDKSAWVSSWYTHPSNG